MRRSHYSVRVCALLLPSAAFVGSAGAEAGRVIAIADEWVLSDPAFAQDPAAAGQFAFNVGKYFGDGQPGKFLVASALPPHNGDARGVNGASLAAAMTGFGHEWTIDPQAPITLEALSAYDGVFLSGKVGSGSENAAALTDYVNAGGSVLVMAGTADHGDAGIEAGAWAPFLSAFGLGFDDQYFAPDFHHIPVVPGPHPLAASLSTFLWSNGQEVFDLDKDNLLNEVVVTGDFTEFGGTPNGTNFAGMVGVYNVPVPAPASAVAFGAVAGLWLRRRR